MIFSPFMYIIIFIKFLKYETIETIFHGYYFMYFCSDCCWIWWTISCLNLVLVAKEWNSLIQINLWTLLVHQELYHDFQMLCIWISFFHQMTTIYVLFSTHLCTKLYDHPKYILHTIKTQNDSCSYVVQGNFSNFL